MSLIKKHIHRTDFTHPKAKFLMLGMILFTFGVITSVASTYAWFAISIKTNIDRLQIGISVQEDYYLDLYYEGADGEPTKDFNDYDFLNYMGYDPLVGLSDVSSMFQEDWYDEANAKELVPEFKRSYGASTSSPDRSYVATQGYLQAVYYLNSNENCEIYLGKDSKVIPNADKNEETAGGINDKYYELMSVTNAVRVSFYTENRYIIAQPDLPEGTPDYVTYYGGVLDMNGDGYYDFIDDKEVLYGQLVGEQVDVPYVEEASENDGFDNNKPRSTFNARHKDNVKRVDVEKLKTSDSIAQENSVKIDDLKYDIDDPLKPITPICKLKKGEMKRLVLSIYVEGWDPYMTDAINKAAFNVDIDFVALIKD